MPKFRLILRDAQEPLHGEAGATWLIGEPEGHADFAVGDGMVVPLRDGTHAVVTVSGFPLVRLNEPSWQVVAVRGVRPGEVDTNGVASVD